MVGNGWSVAWRTYDAQYWGVPQRRKRIYLVADFGSERAVEILSECEGLRGNTSESRTPWKGTAIDAERSVGGSGGVRCLNPWDSQSIRQYAVDGVAPNLSANESGGQNRWGVIYEPKSLIEENWSVCDVKGALRAEASKSACCVVEVGESKSDKKLTCYGVDCRNATLDKEKTHTMQAKANGGISLNCTPSVVYAIQGNCIDRADTAGCNGKGFRTDQMYTLDTVDRPAVAFQLCGDRRNPSVSTSDKAYCIPANPMSDRGQAVCFDARGNGNGQTAPCMTGEHNANIGDYTAVLVERKERE